MTALAAIWRSGAQDFAAAECAAMLAAQEMLGHSARDLASSGDVTLGRCLNAVLPEDRFDRQPLAGASGLVLLVADIRLDNREELSQALGIAPCKAAQLADADVALAAWERWGTGSFARLCGDWAIALWDASRNELILARDPTGMRPLHFHRQGGLIAVATLPRGLHAVSGIAREVDRNFLAASLAMAEREPDHCYYRDVRRVVPGHFVRIGAEFCTIERFWNPPLELLRLPSHDEYAQALSESFDRAVTSRLRGLGNVATQLSGGLDSSAVTESVARQIGAGFKVTAYTARPHAGFAVDRNPVPGRFTDEWDRAATLAARHANIEHVEVRPDPRSIIDALEQHSWLAERPAIAAVNLPWMLAMNAMASSAGHKVMMTGQTGNLSFSHGGDFLHAQRLKRLQLFALWHDLVHLPEGSVAPALRQAIKRILPPSLQMAIEAWRRGGGLQAIASLLRGPSRRDARGRGTDRRRELPRFFEHVDYGAVMKAHLGSSGVEYRDPTADQRLIELCLTIPEEQFLHRGQTRALARTMLKGKVPDAIRLETQRGLQAADWYEALAEESQRVAEMLGQMAGDELLSGLFDISRLQHDMAQLPSDGFASPQLLARYQSGILRALPMASFVAQAKRSVSNISSR